MLRLTETAVATGLPQQFHTAIDARGYLLNSIATRQATVAVIGLGYVGLPLAVSFAEAGFKVVGIDLDQRKVNSLNAGHSYIPDVHSDRLGPLLRLVEASPAVAGLPEKPKRNGHHNGNGQADGGATTNGHAPDGELARPRGCLMATSDYDVLFDADAVIICVPTPLSSTKDPDVSFIVAAADEIARRLHRGMLVVLESTTYPGTTEEVVLPRLQRVKVDRTGLQVGRDFFLAYSPERIDPGREDYTVGTTPKVIGGTTPACLEMAETLYSTAIQTVIPVSDTRTAEMVKILENTFRAVNIALVNEVAIMCDKLGIDVWEVIEAAKSKPYGFMPFYPGPGLGGHCIPIDPQYLAWKMKTLNYTARFIQLAEQVNLAMPEYVLTKITDALNDESKAVKGSRILVLGVAYKADVGDLRESPALDVLHLLHSRGAHVTYNDPYVQRVVLDGLALTSVPLSDEALRSVDCVVIATAHRCYDWTSVMAQSSLIVDTRNATHGTPAGRARVVRL